MRVPWTARRSNPVHPKGDQSWVFIGKTDAEAETPILWPLMPRGDSFEKTLMLRGIGGRRRSGQQRMKQWDGIIDSMEKTLMLGGIGGRRRSGQQRMRWLDGITDSMEREFK